MMFIESKAMLVAMLKLVEDGIPSLSVHDSLIVPVNQHSMDSSPDPRPCVGRELSYSGQLDFILSQRIRAAVEMH
jgi:hypothetical protein